MYACKYLIFMYVHFSSLYNILLHPTKTYYTQNKIPGKCTRLIKYKKYTEKKRIGCDLNRLLFLLFVFIIVSQSRLVCVYEEDEKKKIINVVVFFSVFVSIVVYSKQVYLQKYNFFFISLVHRKSGKNQNKIRNFII